MSTTFRDLGVAADFAGLLAERGVTSPFAIQTAAIPDALAGRDVCGKAPTGSGKTIAFGLPLVERVAATAGKARPRHPRALVLAPTRELASQIERELRPLAALRRRSVATFFGGVGFGPQLAALRSGCDIAVACPGRLADLVRQGELHLDEVAVVVIDEADRMADMGFLPEVRRLLDRVPSDRQTLLFSATLDGDVDVLVKRYQRTPVRHEAEGEGGGVTEHLFWKVSRDQRVGTVAGLATKHWSTLVFCRTKRGADRVAKQLGQRGVTAAAIHGDRSQSQRERALAAFTAGDVAALVATDVAARGIHVDDVACVVHFDPPADEKDYVHRSGRTGRAGRDGTVVTLVSEDTAAGVRQLQRRLGLPSGTAAPDVVVPPADSRSAVEPLSPAPVSRQGRGPGSRRGSAPRPAAPRPAARGHRASARSGSGRRRSRPVRGG